MTLGAPALKEKPDPESTLIGEWDLKSLTVGGRPSESGSDRWAFAAGGTWAISAGGKVFISGPFTWDSKASPGTLGLGRAGDRQPADFCRYRYQIDGDTLTLSVGHDSNVPPADVQPGPNVTVRVFKRAPK
jgi:uncharacterized protein (TIGR03067 family)